jgi:hypothetical protein
MGRPLFDLMVVHQRKAIAKIPIANTVYVARMRWFDV